MKKAGTAIPPGSQSSSRLQSARRPQSHAASVLTSRVHFAKRTSLLRATVWPTEVVDYFARRAKPGIDGHFKDFTLRI